MNASQRPAESNMKRKKGPLKNVEGLAGASSGVVGLGSSRVFNGNGQGY